MNNKNQYIIPFSILGVAFIAGVILFTAAWRANYKANQTITVTGSSKMEIVSDLGVLRGTLSVRSYTAESAYRELNRQKPVLLAYLKSKGFTEDQIEFFTINNYPVYEIGPNGYQTGKIEAYVYSQRIGVTSEDVNRIKEVSLDIPSLIEKGLSFDVEMPEYHYTKLAELKVEIQAAAAKDAMERALKIAEATGRQLGPMRTARMGVLQITPRLSNMISDYGINDLSSIEKEITAVVSASFEIE
ncbi:MAG: hypothetical protein Kow0098_06520 [Ignavibacteriaceae bacterium]